MLSRRLFAATAAGAAAAASASAVVLTEAKAQTAPTDSTMDRVKSSKVLRIAALPGEAPYFNKDLASGQWSGMCIDMAKDIASQFDGTVEYIESTYGNSVLDLQANKIDLAFCAEPDTKARARHRFHASVLSARFRHGRPQGLQGDQLGRSR